MEVGYAADVSEEHMCSIFRATRRNNTEDQKTSNLAL